MAAGVSRPGGGGGGVPAAPPGTAGPGGRAGGAGGSAGCPPGMGQVPATRVSTGQRCPSGTTSHGVDGMGNLVCCGGGGAGVDIGGIMGGFPGGGAGGGAGGTPWNPSDLERPALTPINPEAAYDPEMQAQLEQQRGYTTMLEQGAGRSMDVLTQAQQDQMEAELTRQEQAAAAAGIPFNRQAAAADMQRSINASMAQEKLGREKMIGGAIGAATGAAGEMAGERTRRQELDYRRDVSENELMLDRYGRDIQKYGIDAQASTAANNALLDFYSRLMSGMWSSMGQFGGSSFSSQNYYG